MYTLSCRQCQTAIEVSPSQAGDELPCPSCGVVNPIPNLGELRQLPQSSENASVDRPPASETPVGRRIGFVIFSLLSVLGLITAVFCGIRWFNVDAPLTTEIHLQTVRDHYAELSPAELIREFEDMEKYSLSIATPYTYKQKRNLKNAWGRNALIATVFCLGCGISAVVLAGSGTPKNNAAKDT